MAIRVIQLAQQLRLSNELPQSLFVDFSSKHDLPRAHQPIVCATEHTPLSPRAQLPVSNESRRHDWIDSWWPARLLLLLHRNQPACCRAFALLERLVPAWVELAFWQNDRDQKLHEANDINNFLPPGVAADVGELVVDILERLWNHMKVPIAELSHIIEYQPVHAAGITLLIPRQQLDKRLFHMLVAITLLHQVMIRPILSHQEPEINELIEVDRVCLVKINLLEFELQTSHDVQSLQSIERRERHRQLNVVDEPISRSVKSCKVGLQHLEGPFQENPSCALGTHKLFLVLLLLQQLHFLLCDAEFRVVSRDARQRHVAATHVQHVHEPRK
mmetsp:Transcript_55452/g.135843  ORF Transcript_55452/g.135843 Transcript_55452/m.135843 type:complete len:331 (-) Transcript_55452:600-1592(-)